MGSPTSSPDRTARHLFDAWPDVARRLASAQRLALFTDFDGTLTAIRRHASSVRLSDAVRGRLAALAKRGHLIGVVSGRGLDDVRSRVGVPGLWYVGAHGLRSGNRARRAGGGRPVTTVTLAPRGTAYAVLHDANGPGGYSLAQCRLTAAEGLRVVPPGQRTALFVPWRTRHCAGRGVTALTIGPVGR